MIIKFINWDKHQPRRDLKKPWYLNFQNDFFLDSKMYALDNEERLCLIYLLCEASRANGSGSVQIIQEHYRVHSRLPDRVLSRTIKKLLELRVIEQPRERGLYVSCTPSVQQIRIEEIRIEENRTYMPDSTNPVRPIFDFESLYKKYPRKEGRAAGLKICKAQIKAEEEFSLLSKAIDRYAEHCKKNATEPRYIKHFSSFMSHWRDWLDPDTGTIFVAPPEEPEWKRKAKEKERLEKEKQNAPQ